MEIHRASADVAGFSRTAVRGGSTHVHAEIGALRATIGKALTELCAFIGRYVLVAGIGTAVVAYARTEGCPTVGIKEVWRTITIIVDAV